MQHLSDSQPMKLLLVYLKGNIYDIRINPLLSFFYRSWREKAKFEKNISVKHSNMKVSQQLHKVEEKQEHVNIHDQPKCPYVSESFYQLCYVV